MKPITFALALLPAASSFAALEQERELLRKDPAQAAKVLQERLAQTPGDAYLQYNAAVAAYAAKDFAKADELWQTLAATQMPDTLRDQVWMQIGNVSYRLVQDQIAKEPDQVLPRLEQSREAYRVALSSNKKNATAAKNLIFIEKELEKVYAKLAQRLAEEGKKENNAAKAIEKLEAALDYAKQAEQLSKKDPQRQEERKDIEKNLAQKFDTRAAQEEKIADQRKPENNDWEQKDAQKRLENALADFQQAKALDPQDTTAQAGEKRVEEKLANMLAKAGRQDQKQAEQLAKQSPQMATEKFQEALENFEQALAIQPEHADAKAGEKEVREQLEKMHLEQGDRQAQQGEQQMKNSPEQAADNLQKALENFRTAQALAPKNEEIQPRIDKVEAMLPEALAKLGEREMQQGEKAEQRQANEQAVENFQQAEEAFAKAQEMQPGNKEAEQGQQKAQAALARLQQKMAQQQANQPKPGQEPQNSKDPQEAKEAFQSMLAKLKEDQKDKDVQAKHHAGERYQEERNKNLRNW